MLGGLRIKGLHYISPSGAAIVAANHLSWADPPALRSVIRRKCWFMANDFLLRIPVLGPLLPMYGAFPVRRGVLDRDAIRQAEEHLAAGDLLTVFPEGGTTLSGRLMPFEGGVALLALRANVPIVPAAITGTDRVLPAETTRLRYARGGVTITFGPAINPAEIDPLLPHRKRMDLLTERLYDAIAALLPPEYLPDPNQGAPVKLAGRAARSADPADPTPTSDGT